MMSLPLGFMSCFKSLLAIAYKSGKLYIIEKAMNDSFVCKLF